MKILMVLVLFVCTIGLCRLTYLAVTLPIQNPVYTAVIIVMMPCYIWVFSKDVIKLIRELLNGNYSM